MQSQNSTPTQSPWPELPGRSAGIATPDGAVDPDRRKRVRPHPAISALILGAIALLPCVFVRRQTGALRKELMVAEAKNTGLRKNVKMALAEIIHVRTEHIQLVKLLEENKRAMEGLKGQMDRMESSRVDVDLRIHGGLKDMGQTLQRLEADGVQRDRTWAEWENTCRNDLKALLRDAQQTRSHLAAVQEVGTSLAHVAAFMHEVEVRQGYVPRNDDGRGIEQMRHLAKKLQEAPGSNFGQELKETEKAASGTNSDTTSRAS
ncbi:uncharacterized protein FIBRA_03833 [Fibroporia radiculosa]|uniref:Uncharacterized protein n=1 Tax=Fibroporia radiculosa TaxID=599839 RepID=J4HW74_9APHY|nr:uncharacterized protein FIBRA_03833 [Fibroporia radiculosa]CCM01767.1 predicted protein [Fibroporia radiculosa]